MTTEMAEKAANISQNIFVRTTVRLSPELHQRLADRVHEMGKGLPPRQRPSIDSVIQQALQSWLDGTLTTGVGHSPDLSLKSAGVPSANGPRTTVSPDEDRLRQILDEYEARILERIAEAGASREARHTPASKRKAGRG